MDDETEHALGLLTQAGRSRPAAIRQAVSEASRHRKRAAKMRREVRMNLGQPNGVNVAEELADDRADGRG